jgi:hypothetical protein
MKPDNNFLHLPSWVIMRARAGRLVTSARLGNHRKSFLGTTNV